MSVCSQICPLRDLLEALFSLFLKSFSSFSRAVSDMTFHESGSDMEQAAVGPFSSQLPCLGRTSVLGFFPLRLQGFAVMRTELPGWLTI